MNREIKFRAWDKKTKQIREASELKFDGTHYNVRIIIPTESAPRNWSVRMFDEVEIMQYTGLKDKNGVEIYEGDIVKIHNYNTTWKYAQPSFDWRIFEIKYNVCTWAFNNEAIYMPMSDYSTYDGTPYDIEIIGNIYQNPELINSI